MHFTYTIHTLYIYYTFTIHTLYTLYTIHTLYIHYTHYTLYIHYTYTVEETALPSTSTNKVVNKAQHRERRERSDPPTFCLVGANHGQMHYKTKAFRNGYKLVVLAGTVYSTVDKNWKELPRQITYQVEL